VKKAVPLIPNIGTHGKKTMGATTRMPTIKSGAWFAGTRNWMMPVVPSGIAARENFPAKQVFPEPDTASGS
jgi:hypothetical protein